jgi:prevent-host-death family protein
MTKMIKLIIKVLMMQVAATEAKREFGDLLLKAQTEPVRILRNGKPVVAVISNDEYESYKAFKTRQLKQAIAEGLEDFAVDRVHDGKDIIKDLMELAK